VPEVETLRILNEIVGGVIGTISAVAAVLLTDWFRDRRKATHVIPARLRADRDYAVSRAAEVGKALEADSQGRYTASKAQRFDVASYTRLIADAFSHLTPWQRKKLAGITFAMELADEANAEAMRAIAGEGAGAERVAALQALTRREKFMLERTRALIDEYFATPASGGTPRPPGTPPAAEASPK
jgi:hypothetical protein